MLATAAAGFVAPYYPGGLTDADRGGVGAQMYWRAGPAPPLPARGSGGGGSSRAALRAPQLAWLGSMLAGEDGSLSRAVGMLVPRGGAAPLAEPLARLELFAQVRPPPYDAKRDTSVVSGPPRPRRAAAGRRLDQRGRVAPRGGARPTQRRRGHRRARRARGTGGADRTYQ